MSFELEDAPGVALPVGVHLRGEGYNVAIFS
jgi:hypothetical protein